MKQRSIAYFLLISILCACTQVPKIPELSQAKPKPIEQIVLRDAIGPKDVRDIFRALNSEHRLDSLKPWIETASDADLEVLGRFLSKQLYEDAYSSHGLLSILHDRTVSRSFSHYAVQLQNSRQKPQFKSLIHLLGTVFTQADLGELLERDIFLFDDSWLNQMRTLNIPPADPNTVLFDNKKLWNDVRKFISQENNRTSLSQLGSQLEQTEYAKGFFLALKDLRNETSDKSFSDLSNELFKRLPKRGEESSDSKSEIEQFLDLIDTLNRPSAGLFTQAQTGLQSESGETFIGLLGTRLNSLMLRTLNGYLRRDFERPYGGINLDKAFWLSLARQNESDNPSPSFSHLIRRIRDSFKKLSNTTLENKNYILDLNAYILTAWLEQWAKANRPYLESLPNEINWQEFWKKSIPGSVFNLSLLELDENHAPKKDAENRNILSNKIANDLKTIGLSTLSADLQRAVKLDSFGKTTLKFPASATRPFAHSMLDATERIQATQPFFDTVPFFSAIVFALIEPKDVKSFSLSSLETNNLLLSLNRLIQGLSPDMLDKLITFVFEDLHLDRLDEEDRKALTDLYPENSEAAKLLNSLLSQLGVFYSISKKSPNHSVGILDFYHRWLLNLRPNELTKLGDGFGFLKASNLFGREATINGREVLYPGISEWIQSPNGLALALKRLANSTKEQEIAFLRGLAAFSTPPKKTSGLILHLNFFNSLIKANPEEWEQIFEANEYRSLFPDFSSKELAWCYRYIQSGEHKALLDFFAIHTHLDNLVEVATELMDLESRAGLEDAFTLLSNIKNERMQRLALGLLEWEKAQELRAFLSSIKSLK